MRAGAVVPVAAVAADRVEGKLGQSLAIELITLLHRINISTSTSNSVASAPTLASASAPHRIAPHQGGHRQRRKKAAGAVQRQMKREECKETGSNTSSATEHNQKLEFARWRGHMQHTFDAQVCQIQTTSHRFVQ
jgi:hypothetical protein